MITKFLPFVNLLHCGTFLFILGFPLLGSSQIKFGLSPEKDIEAIFNKGRTDFVDIDGDGDQDLFLTGKRDGRSIWLTKLYLNNGLGDFSEKQGATLPPFLYGDSVFEDIDGDGDKDLFITGQSTDSYATAATILYQNDGQGNFEEIEVPGLLDLYLSDALIADFDGNGTSDLFITGQNYSNKKTMVQMFSNNGNGTFTEVEVEISPTFNPSLKTVDIDEDGDLDILSVAFSKSVIYINEGSFNFSSRIIENLPMLTSGILKMSDFENDGDLDLFLSGNSNKGIIAKLYQNDGTGNFTEIPAPEQLPIIVDSAEFFDVDNDGDEDLLVVGRKENGFAYTFLFSNNGPGTFIYVRNTEYMGGENGNLAVADVNSDGLLDYVLIGSKGWGVAADLYLNTTHNRLPVITNVQIIGKPIIGETLTSTFDYCDADGDQHKPSYVWYRVKNLNNTKKLFSREKDLTITSDDLGYYIQSGVLERDQLGTGTYIFSQWIGPIEARSTKMSVFANSQNIQSGAAPSSDNHTHFGTQVMLQTFPRNFFIKNEGNIDLIIEGLKVSGDQATDYTIIGPTSFCIEPEEEINFTTEFRPLGLGERTASITFNTNDPDQVIFTINISGEGSNNPPVFLSNAEITTAEGPAIPLFDLDATNGEEEEADLGVSYSISGGEDAVLFNIAEESGVLQFITPPDFEAPGDQDLDNVYVVEIAAKDGFELVTKQSFFITVTDFDEDPVALCVGNFDLFLDEEGKASLEVAQVDSGSWDDSGSISLSLSKTEFSCSDLGTHTVELIAQAGNKTSTCSVLVTVIDDIEPSIDNLPNIEADNDEGKSSAVIIIQVPTATDNCGLPILNGSRDDNAKLEDPFPVGETIITWTVSDTSENIGQRVDQKVTVKDVEKPIFDSVEDISVATDQGGCGATIEILPPNATDNCGAVAITASRDLEEPFLAGTTEITWTATDNSGNIAQVIQKVTVTNAAPSSVLITGPQTPLLLGSEVALTATFSDENMSRATWTAFDGNNYVGPFEGDLSNGTASHTFKDLPAGIYSIQFEIEDFCGAVTTANLEYIVIFDPEGGFVTGTGWINSPPGALKGSEVSGKADFGFNAKYKIGKRDFGEVGGNMRFKLKVGDLTFNSSSIEKMSLVISGGYKATFMGQGSVNGKDGYSFLASVIDEDHTTTRTEDTFRIKIWNENGVLYDNNLLEVADNANPETSIGSGNIVIQKPKVSTKELMAVLPAAESVEDSDGLLVFTAYPNPMGESAEIEFQLDYSSKAVLALYDMNGREVARLYNGTVEKGENNKVRLFKGQLMQGIYFYRLTTDRGRTYQKQLLIN